MRFVVENVRVIQVGTVGELRATIEVQLVEAPCVPTLTLEWALDKATETKIGSIIELEPDDLPEPQHVWKWDRDAAGRLMPGRCAVCHAEAPPGVIRPDDQ